MGGSRPTSLRGLFANLPAHVVFLLVERLLLQRTNVPAILARHVPFFLADLVIFPVKLVGLPLGNIAFLDLVINPLVLVLQTIVYLLPPWMILSPVARDRSARRARHESYSQNHSRNFHDCATHVD